MQMWKFFEKQSETHSFAGPECLNQFFFDHYAPVAQLRTRSFRHKYVTYNKHFAKSLGMVPWAALTQAQVNSWLSGQMALGLKRSTVNKHIILFNHLMKQAQDWGVLPETLRRLPKAERLAIGDYRQRFLSQAEIARLVSACDRVNHPYLGLFIRLLILTGARKGEARLMRWCDVDLQTGLWIVPRSKNGRSRRIHLSQAALDVLHSARIRTQSLGLADGPDAPVFTNPRSKKPYGSFHLAFFKARDAAGLSEVRIHDLRHTFASLLINNGVSLYEVQELLGQSSAAMTQRYAHLQPNRLRNRTEIVGRMLQ